MQTEPEPLLSTLALSLLPAMTPRLYHALVKVYAGPGDVLQADPDRLGAAGLKPALVNALRAYQALGADAPLGRQIHRALEWSRQPGNALLYLEGPGYPELLAAIPDPPPILYIKGKAGALSAAMLAMVGSRNPSPGGRRLARRIAGGMCARGFAIASGMALGIDAESHRGALEAGGTTVAVLGTGVDGIYPGRNRKLGREIAAQGALVSEFPLGTPPHPWHFPMRNRIISGLSRGVLVVEAASRSGSLITAHYALEQGREVFAVPGSIDNPMTRGCHLLLKSGAKLVEKVDDILEEFGLEGTAAPAVEPDESRGPDLEPAWDEAEDTVLRQIGYDALSLDGLAGATGLDAATLGATLIQLEIKGKVRRTPRGYTLP